MAWSNGEKAIYNPFDTGSEKAKEYDRWAVLLDHGEYEAADEIFKRNNSGMTFYERNGNYART